MEAGDRDAERHTASAQPVDGGTRVQLTCTAIERRVPDGGFEPLCDRAIDVVAP
jgi:hypothetical protein